MSEEPIEPSVPNPDAGGVETDDERSDLDAGLAPDPEHEVVETPPEGAGPRGPAGTDPTSDD